MSTIARFLLLALAMSVGLGTLGCRAQVRATATVEEPDLVLVENDVWVVEHYNEPVFYTEGYYWRWSGGVWYRSTVHTGNWIQVTVVPAPVQRIPNPQIYVNYTAQAGAEKRKGPPDHAPAHGVRGTEPGHEAGGPGHEPPGHEMGVPPGHEKAGGPPMKEEKAGPPAKEEKVGPPAKEEKAAKPEKPAKEEKGPPAKEEKAAKPEKPAKEEKGPPAKEEKAAKPEKPAKEEKAPPAKEEKKEEKKGGKK